MTPLLVEIWRKEPLKMKQALWPHVTFYDKQIEIIHSVRDNTVTMAPAGNMLGKDFVSAFIVLWFFICFYSLDRSRKWVRVVTTSVKDEHLDVLWAEIAGFVANSRMPLLADDGGLLVLNHHEIRHVSERDLKNSMNYVKGMVAMKPEAIQGHHAENTLFVGDEASGIEDQVYDMAATWMKRALIIGNPMPCNNYFFKGVKAGDLQLDYS